MSILPNMIKYDSDRKKKDSFQINVGYLFSNKCWSFCFDCWSYLILAYTTWNDSFQSTSRISHSRYIFSFRNISKIGLVCVTENYSKIWGLTKLNFISRSSLHVHFRLTRKFVLIAGTQAPRLTAAPSGNTLLGWPQQGGENGANHFCFQAFVQKWHMSLPLTFL